MTIHELQRRKEELGYSDELIAALSGVTLETIEALFSDEEVSAITYEDRIAVENLLKEPSENILREEQAVYYGKKQGAFTIEDYYAIPDNEKYELIDGVLIKMDAASVIHQLVVTELIFLLKKFIEESKGECRVLTEPDVQLDCDDRTMVKPDVIVVCDKNKFLKKCIYGAGDLIIEILSPSTRIRDMTTKLAKYMNAGVREYWIVDLEKKRILVYNWEKEDVMTIYGFQDKIPVGIFNGKCEVDFAQIYEEIAPLFEN